MNMTRQEMEERLVDFLYDELEADDRARFEASLSAHPEVQAEVAAHTSTRSMLASSGALDELRMPPGLLDSVMREARVVAAPVEEPRASWLDKLLALLMQPAMAVALVTVLMAGTGIYLARQGGGEPTMADSVALQAPPNAAGSPEGAEPPELAAVAEKPAAEEEAPADEAPVAAAAAEPESGMRTVAEGALARLQPVTDEMAEANAAEAPPLVDLEVPGSTAPTQPYKPKASEPRRLAVRDKVGSAKKVNPALFDDDARGSLGETAYAGAEKKKAEAPAKASAKPVSKTASDSASATPPPSQAPQPEAPAGSPSTKDGRLNQVQTAEEQRALDPMDTVRKEAASQGKDAERGRYLLAQLDKFAAAGREDLVDQTLALLEKVPGWEAVARGRRSAAVARRATGAGGGPAAAPAEREYDYEDTKARPSSAPAPKKGSK
ncbi:MAG: hypothetical protein R3F39_09865 [Myxococcota bacterium]